MPNPVAEPLLTPDFLARLERLDVLSRRVLAGKMKGERRSKRRGQSVEFADFRNYVVGDDLRFIDWNLYARLDRLFLKLFLEEEDLALHVLIDASRSADFGTPNKFDYMKRVAAALGYVGLVNYNRVTVSAMSAGVIATTGPMRGKTRVGRLLDFVQDLQATEAGDLAAACRQFATQQRGRGVCVVLSDFFDKGGVENGLRYLATGRYDLFGVQVLSPQEIDPDLTGDLKLIDLEDADAAEVSITRPLIERYKANLNAYCLTVKEIPLPPRWHVSVHEHERAVRHARAELPARARAVGIRMNDTDRSKRRFLDATARAVDSISKQHCVREGSTARVVASDSSASVRCHSD